MPIRPPILLFFSYLVGEVKGPHKRLRKGDTLLQEGATVDAPAPLERVDTTTKCPTSGVRCDVFLRAS